MHPRRLGSVATLKARIAERWIDGPEDQHIRAIADLAERGARATTSLRRQNSFGHRGRRHAVDEGMQLIRYRDCGALRFTREIRREVDERCACGAERIRNLADHIFDGHRAATEHGTGK